jgi:L-alanine-DL-glutamate epimerase-like enolase superfamily enzyme
MKLILRDIALPLRHPFTIAHGTTTVQENLLVELREDGVSGFGEGASSDAYKAFTAQSMRADLEKARHCVEAERLEDPAALWDRLLPVLGHNRFALCALDQAAHDLWGKKRGQPVWKLWGLQLRNLPLSNYTLGMDSIEKMVMKMREFEGWPIYKIKLGTEEDLAIVRELRRHTSATFRVDANCAWTVEQTLRLAPELKALGVEFIEQPLPAGEAEGMLRVFAHCALPVIADESCLVEEDVPRCAGRFHGINIKLTKAGGLTPARRMICRARELGLKTMVGCMVESTVGISAIAQLLPLLDYVDMDGATLIARDVASGVRVEKGRAVFPEENGNGVRLLEKTE